MSVEPMLFYKTACSSFQKGGQ